MWFHFYSCVLVLFFVIDFFFFFKQKTAYELRISDWSSDVCSSDLIVQRLRPSYFPFTEPSAEVDVGYAHEKGRRIVGGNGDDAGHAWMEIGRASCRESVCQYV